MGKMKINLISLSLIGVLWIMFFIHLLAVLISMDHQGFQTFFQSYIFIDGSNSLWIQTPWILVTYSLFHDSFFILSIHSVLIFLLMNSWEFTFKKTLIIWGVIAICGGVVFIMLNESGVLIGPSFVISFLTPYLFIQNLKTKNELVFFGLILYVILFCIEVAINGFGETSLLHMIGVFFGILCCLILVFLNMRFLNRLRIWMGLAPRLSVNQKNPRFKSDEEFNQERKLKGEYLDFILDKISRSGFESLSKAERKFLEENKG
jgi:hypothetical protein